jgi:ribonuclease HII
MTEFILGIDDAGRGPVVGPMITAGCLIDKETERYFKKIGVKDSKQITPKRREILNKEIKEKAKAFEILVCSPDKIDKNNENKVKLNELEANHFAKIINKLNKEDIKIKVVVDCPSTNILKFTDYLRSKIKNLSNLEISCEHKADKNHVAVSAASILAKFRREQEMDKIKKIYGPEIGSGYTSDPATIKFLEKYAKKYKDKGIFRKSWITWKRAFNKLNQSKLKI